MTQLQNCHPWKETARVISMLLSLFNFPPKNTFPDSFNYELHVGNDPLFILYFFLNNILLCNLLFSLVCKYLVGISYINLIKKKKKINENAWVYSFHSSFICFASSGLCFYKRTFYDRISKCLLYSSFHMFELNTNKTNLYWNVVK